MYSTGSSDRCSVMIEKGRMGWEGEWGGRGYMYTYDWLWFFMAETNTTLKAIVLQLKIKIKKKVNLEWSQVETGQSNPRHRAPSCPSSLALHVGTLSLLMVFYPFGAPGGPQPLLFQLGELNWDDNKGSQEVLVDDNSEQTSLVLPISVFCFFLHSCNQPTQGQMRYVWYICIQWNITQP